LVSQIQRRSHAAAEGYLALKVKEVTGDWRKLHNEELYDLNTPHQILLRVLKSWRI
jgi:hypothetical protein